uniref:Uncharacterized protein n=1 Tax=Tanacetum cinerariifolium TaxID=118510 RepID=A0A6L2MJM1_TANCI|nr:hypothetical protein [Tanacetum cinerariifolium]
MRVLIFAIVNVFLGYILIMYLEYDIAKIVNSKFEIDYIEYGKQGKVNLSTFFAITYGFGFATIASTLTRVGLFYGKEIYQRYKACTKGKVDVHTSLMRNYKDIPLWIKYKCHLRD